MVTVVLGERGQRGRGVNGRKDRLVVNDGRRDG